MNVPGRTEEKNTNQEKVNSKQIFYPEQCLAMLVTLRYYTVAIVLDVESFKWSVQALSSVFPNRVSLV